MAETSTLPKGCLQVLSTEFSGFLKFFQYLYYSRFLIGSTLVRPSQGLDTWLVNCDYFHETYRVNMCLLLKFLSLNKNQLEETNKKV